VSAGLSLSPRAQQLGLYFLTYPDAYIQAADTAYFLRGLLRHLRGAVIVVWDNGPNHKGEPLRELRAAVAGVPPSRTPLNWRRQLAVLEKDHGDPNVEGGANIGDGDGGLRPALLRCLHPLAQVKIEDPSCSTPTASAAVSSVSPAATPSGRPWNSRRAAALRP
jgi:hypothetical protein